MPDAVADIRAFNRFYTRQIGLLEEHMPSSPYSLQESRLIYEIATRGEAAATELARDLGIDPGYLSRMVQKLVAADLVALTPSASDRRRNQIALTSAGEQLFAALDGASDAAVAGLIGPLDDGRRSELVAAMAAIRRLLDDPTERSTVVLRPHRLGELGWLIHRQGLLYNRQFGWNAEFEALIARIYAEYEAAPGDPPKALWIADRGDEVAGSIFVLPATGRPDTAQLRMLYVEPTARGLGLGTMLVDQALSFARASGFRRMRLWTQSILVSARRIYDAAGFRCVESAPHHSFGKDLIGQYLELELTKVPAQ
jgi:DNA-binding MarR family transcriptional regulator/GNAT superfamily N-acetyltransferase